MSENVEQYKKFKNELDHLEICPRCAKGVKVFIRKVITVDRFHGLQQASEIHCAKCMIHEHKDGTFIKTTFPSEGGSVTAMLVDTPAPLTMSTKDWETFKSIDFG